MAVSTLARSSSTRSKRPSRTSWTRNSGSTSSTSAWSTTWPGTTRHNALVISMTLTSAACPLTDVIEEDIAQSLDGVVEAFRINWVWMPPWGPDKITDDGRDAMRALGFSI